MKKIALLLLAFTFCLFSLGQTEKQKPPQPALYAKKFTDLRAAIKTSMAVKAPLIIDSIELSNDCIPEHHPVYDGPLYLKAAQGKRGSIIFNFRKAADELLYGLILSGTCHLFENIDFICGQQTANGTASAIKFFQKDSAKIIFKNCTFSGPWRDTLIITSTNVH